MTEKLETKAVVWLECRGEVHHGFNLYPRNYCTTCSPYWEKYPTCPDCGHKVYRKYHGYFCPHCQIKLVESQPPKPPTEVIWVKCAGEAHSNPFIDHCMVCMPWWGCYPTCPICGKKVVQSQSERGSYYCLTCRKHRTECIKPWA